MYLPPMFNNGSKFVQNSAICVYDKKNFVVVFGIAMEIDHELCIDRQ
jgi:hypothetical protein